MATVTVDGVNADPRLRETLAEVQYEKWNAWPVNWSGIWTGTLASVVALILFGLIGLAVGAQIVDPEYRVVDLSKIALGALAFSVFSTFLAFAIGGWVAGKVAGTLRSEPAMLHGAIVWLTAVPLLVVLIGLGAGGSLGAWYASFAGSGRGSDTPYTRPESPGEGATQEETAKYQEAVTEYRNQVEQWRKDTPKVTRNSAITAASALLLGLIGSVIGGWMASGEPMTFRRQQLVVGKQTDRLVRV